MPAADTTKINRVAAGTAVALKEIADRLAGLELSLVKVTGNQDVIASALTDLKTELKGAPGQESQSIRIVKLELWIDNLSKDVEKEKKKQEESDRLSKSRNWAVWMALGVAVLGAIVSNLHYLPGK